jgi:hypothetical protein
MVEKSLSFGKSLSFEQLQRVINSTPPTIPNIDFLGKLNELRETYATKPSIISTEQKPKLVVKTARQMQQETWLAEKRARRISNILLFEKSH